MVAGPEWFSVLVFACKSNLRKTASAQQQMGLMKDQPEICEQNADTRPLFERFSNVHVRALIEEYPLAWICVGSGAEIEASLLPLVGVFDKSGALVELIGHLMRSNPLYEVAQREPRATVLFRGPDAYVSPSHAGRRDWAPTWNYAQLRVATEIQFDEADTENALRVLIEAMESRRDQPWTIEELGKRADAMLGRIIGFRAKVTRVSAKFKLGQDEAPAIFNTILERLPQREMVDWMRKFGEDR